MSYLSIFNHPIYWALIGVVIYALLSHLYKDRLIRFLNIYGDTIIVGCGVILFFSSITFCVVATSLILALPVTKICMIFNYDDTILMALLLCIMLWSIIFLLKIYDLIEAVQESNNSNSNEDVAQ